MAKIALVFPLVALTVAIIISVFILIRRSRRYSILNIKGRNKHFAELARALKLNQTGDDYFTQLEGTWKDFRVIIYPHNFQGPGSITLFYADTSTPYIERTWIEPNLSLGRAIVEWKRNPEQILNYEYCGDSTLHTDAIRQSLSRFERKYPFLAITGPSRFIFSHYVMRTVGSWNNFVVLLVLDSGRKPQLSEVKDALDAAVEISSVVRAAANAE